MRQAKRVREAPAREGVSSEPLSRDAITSAVRDATLAPSVLNIQPWQFVVRRGVIEVHRDPKRILRAVDPYHRAMTISCGAALFNLRLALIEQGRRPDVELLPEGPRSLMMARVTPTYPIDASHSGSRRRLYAALAARRTSRVPFVDEPLPPETVIRLEEAAAAESASFRILSADMALDVSDLVHEADRAQRSDAELFSEIRRWVDRGPDALDGIPRDSLGPTAADPGGLVRDFAMGSPVAGRPSVDFECHPTLGIFLTRDDDSRAWLQAGQALERVWLEATVTGLAVSLMTQPLEVSILRWLARPLTARSPRPPDDLRDVGGDTSARPFWPQVLLRIGVASSHTPPTPRRQLSDVLTFV